MGFIMPNQPKKKKEKKPSNMERTLIQAFIEQFENDLKDKDYTAIDEVLTMLITKKSNQKAMIGFLSDDVRERMIEGKLQFRY